MDTLSQTGGKNIQWRKDKTSGAGKTGQPLVKE